MSAQYRRGGVMMAADWEPVLCPIHPDLVRQLKEPRGLYYDDIDSAQIDGEAPAEARASTEPNLRGARAAPDRTDGPDSGAAAHCAACSQGQFFDPERTVCECRCHEHNDGEA